MKNKKSGGGTSLLSKSLRQFTLCTVASFVLIAPLFYLLTKYFYAEDLMDVVEAAERGEIIRSFDLEQDIIAGMMLQYLFIFIVIGIALFITVRFATKKLWRPFDDTLRKAGQFNLTQGDIPHFMETDIAEFAHLNRSLRRLMKKDRDFYRIQKEFTENASHELQTPLAIIRSKLDLLMSEDLSESQMQLIADLYELTTRMGYLNRNLLLLAKIENAQYTALEDIDPVSLLYGSMPHYESLQNGRTLQIHDLRTDRGKKIQANPVLLDCLLKNLIVNAIRHSEEGAEIQISVGDRRITVANTSSDGQPLDGSTLFCRFRAGNASQKGNGLGLAIVKAICDFHHWTVRYEFDNGRHCFTVGFESN